jgi:hypothetical protein
VRAAGSKVTYFAGYRHLADRYRIEDIEAASDVVVWCCDEPPGFSPRRPQDRAFVGNLVQGMQAYASGALGKQAIPFSSTDRIIAIGSDRMMAAVTKPATASCRSTSSPPTGPSAPSTRRCSA